MARKIITNSPDAWNLTGVAKRLSFAVANMNLPIANLRVDTPGGGSVSVFKHGDMEIWDLKSGGRTYFRIKIVRDDAPDTPLGDEDRSSAWALRKIQGIEILSKEESEPSRIGVAAYMNAMDDGYYLKYNDSGGTAGTIYKGAYWEFDGNGWVPSYPTYPRKMPYIEGGVHKPGEYYAGSSYERLSTDGYYVRVTGLDSIPVYYKTDATGTSGTDKRTTIGPLGTSGNDGTSGTFWPKILVKQPQDITIQIPLWKVGNHSYDPPAEGTSGTSAFPVYINTTSVLCKFTVNSSLPYQVNQLGFYGYTTAGYPYVGTSGTRGDQACAPKQVGVHLPGSYIPFWYGVNSVSGTISLTLTYSDGQTQVINSFNYVGYGVNPDGSYYAVGNVLIQPHDLPPSAGVMGGDEHSISVGVPTGSVTIMATNMSSIPPTPPEAFVYPVSGLTIATQDPLFAWVDTPIIY